MLNITILLNITNLVNISNTLTNTTNLLNNQTNITNKSFNYIYSNQVLCGFQNTILNCLNSKCKNLKSSVQDYCKIDCLKNEQTFIQLITETCFNIYKSNNNCNQFQFLSNKLNKCNVYNNFNYLNSCYNDILMCPKYQIITKHSSSDVSYLAILAGLVFCAICCCKTRKIYEDSHRVYSESIFENRQNNSRYENYEYKEPDIESNIKCKEPEILPKESDFECKKNNICIKICL